MHRLYLLIPLIILISSPLHAQDEPTPLIIGFYGAQDSPGANGMRLAVAEINQAGGFEGPDGITYIFQARTTSTPSALTDAVAILAEPDMIHRGLPTAWQMPVFLLSPDAGLALQNIQATVFRGITDQHYQNDALADYLVNELEVTEITVIGSEAFANIQSRVTPTPPQIQYLRKDTLTADHFNAIPQAIYYAGKSGATFVEALKAADWRGILVYRHPDPIAPIEGVRLINVTSWLPTLKDELSQTFTATYTAAYDETPDAAAVAAYDLTWAMRLLITRVGADPHTLVEAIPHANTIFTTQGEMRPSDYGGRELIRTVTIYEILPDGSITVLSHQKDNGTN